MPVDTRINIPFIPQEGITGQILQAIQLANEEHVHNQQQAFQQQQLAQQAPLVEAQTEEAKSRSGFYGSQAAKNQLDVDRMKAVQQLFAAGPGGSAQPQGQPAQAPQAAPQQAPAQAQPWVPQGTPPQLAPIIGAMLPQDLNDQEKAVIEGGAQAGRMSAIEKGDLAGYLNEVRAGVDAVVQNRNKLTNSPENQPLTDADRANFSKNVLPSMANLSSAQQKLAQGALAGAKTQRDLQQLEGRLMAQDGQALAKKIQQENIVANKEIALQGEEGKQGLSDIIKTWTDPQHGYTATLSQAKAGQTAIQAGVDGSGLATSLAPTMVVLGMNSFAGTHRISPAEAQAAGAPGGWSERFNAWLDKSVQGTLSPQLAKEGNQIFDQLIDAKYQQSIQNSKLIVANTPGMTAKSVKIPTRDGDDTINLSDAKSQKAAPAAPAFKVPEGAPTAPAEDGHTLKMNGKDIAVSKGGAWVNLPNQ